MIPTKRKTNPESNNQKRRKDFLKGLSIKKQRLMRAEQQAEESSGEEDVSDIEAGSNDEGEEIAERIAADDTDTTSSEGESEPEAENKEEEPVREIDAMVSLSKGRWVNKQRVLLVGSRGTSNKVRHLIKDLAHLLPHTKTETKMNKQGGFAQINEMAEYKNCQNMMFFEARKRKDTFLWMSPDASEGPSVRFLVENVHTMAELRFTGNCLTRSRPILSFHEDFDDAAKPEMQLIKLCLQKSFTTPRYHPKSQPFIDHIFNFSIVDGKIWFRNYQVDDITKDIVEVGPRFTLTPACVFAGSFQGAKVWKNEDYQSPNERRRMIKQMKIMHRSNPEKRAYNDIIREKAVEGLEKHAFATEAREEVFK